MAQASLGRPLTRRSPVEWTVDRIWRFLCSVRAAAAEIAFLALLVLVGTLRGSSVPFWIGERLPFASGLVERWYAWDVFRSLVFMATLTLLAVAIAICTANRAPGVWASIARPTVATSHGFLRNADASARFETDQRRDELTASLATALRTARYRILTEERSGETHLYADRFRWGKLGTFPFHLALILLLVGAVVGARWGFREMEFIVAEGDTREVGYGTGLSIRVDDFIEDFNENGMPREYRSDLTVLAGEDAVAAGSIEVNSPLTYRDTVVYQAGFGQAARFRITDDAGNLLLEEALPLGSFQAKTNPDAPAAVLDILPAGTQLTVIAPDTNRGNKPELDQLQLRSGQMYLQLRPLPGRGGPATPIESVIDQGQTIRLGELGITFVREQRFTVLQVARNPAIPIFITAAVLLLGGLAVAFYFPHRRIRGIITASPGGRTQATLAPMARRDWSAQRVFSRLVDDLERAVPSRVERRFAEPVEPRPSAIDPANAPA
ncbi:MAG: cytochrome c biogenesis protein ResB [Chloroflexia bacterium]|nr:cytochrome c biogenesis protein ResB [Chloroflexia bacterium]